MILDIVQAPNEVLSAKAKQIVFKDGKLSNETAELIKDMEETLVDQKDPEGIGLAAPQVGKSLQLFIVKYDESSPFDVYINPKLELIPDKPKKKLTKEEEEERDRLEGCLSLKVIWGTVKRNESVHMEWTDEMGKEHKATFRGFYATILQHEYDHLQGILFPRRVLEQKGQLYKSHKGKDGKDVFDPVEV